MISIFRRRQKKEQLNSTSGNSSLRESSVEWKGHADQRFGAYTYAQHGDDLIVAAIFDSIGIKNPTYIDIGAHHPFNISNTALLYKRGSRGINVEANPLLYENFVQLRPEDVNLNVGVSSEARGEMDFYMVDDWSGRNSFSKDMVEEFVRAHPQFSITKVLKVKVQPLNDIIRDHAHGVYPDFMSIDVEGLDEEILRSLDIRVDGPKVICVETVDATGKREDRGIRDWLKSQGYFCLMHCAGNSIFVRNEYEAKVR